MRRGSIGKSIEIPGVQLEFNVETTGYDGGDSSVTTISLRPFPGYAHRGSVCSRNSTDLGYYPVETDEALHVSFSAHGDMELDVLRAVVKEIDRALDQLLGEPHSTPQVTHHYTSITD